MDEAIIKKIEALPKMELHRHLEGCISAELLLQIAEEYEVNLPTRKLEELRPLIQVKENAVSLKDFLDKFYWLGLAFPNMEAVERVAYYVCRDCARDNIRYVELRFSPLFMSLEIHHSWEDLLHAVLKGTRRAEKEFDIETGLIVGVSRSNSLKQALRVVDIAWEYAGLGVVGVDLFGDEEAYPPEIFSPAFRVAREGGLNVTVHAGEGGGETNIRTAIEVLGAQRIGHGVKIINDKEMMSWVRDRGIPLEISLTSNIQTGTVPSLREHPLRRLYDYGIKVSLNTDDPAISDTTLSREYLLAMEYQGFTFSEIKGLVLSALEQSFLPDYRRQPLRARLERELAAIS